MKRPAVGAGVVLQGATGPVRVEGFERGADGRLVGVVLQCSGRRVVPFSELCLEALANGRASVDQLELPAGPAWAELPEAERHRLEERARDLMQVLTGSRRGNPEADRTEGRLTDTYDPARSSRSSRLAAKARELAARGERGASRAQLSRQLAAFQTEGVLGLVDARVQSRLAPIEVDEAIEKALGEFLVSRSGEARVSDARLAVMARAWLEAAGVEFTGSGRQLLRILGQLSRGMALHREARSRQVHDNKPQKVYGRLTVSRPGEVVQIDATTTTIHCWFPSLGWARATILTGIDVYSRCIVALRVVPGSVTSRDVAYLLWDMGRPEVSRHGWPYELQSWHGGATPGGGGDHPERPTGEGA